MRIERTQCDICNKQFEYDGNITTMHLGRKIIGSPDYQDICEVCTLWMIKEFDKKRLHRE